MNILELSEYGNYVIRNRDINGIRRCNCYENLCFILY